MNKLHFIERPFNQSCALCIKAIAVAHAAWWLSPSQVRDERGTTDQALERCREGVECSRGITRLSIGSAWRGQTPDELNIHAARKRTDRTANRHRDGRHATSVLGAADCDKDRVAVDAHFDGARDGRSGAGHRVREHANQPCMHSLFFLESSQ